MSEVPDGAQISDDGNFWWDGTDWQPVGGGDGGAAAFDFDMSGLRIDAENSPVPSDGEPLKAGFAICNTGTAAGQAQVTFSVDGQDTGVTWDSPWIAAGECATPDGDGYVHGLPGQSEGDHTFEAAVNPPGQNGGRASNTISVGARE